MGSLQIQQKVQLIQGLIIKLELIPHLSTGELVQSSRLFAIKILNLSSTRTRKNVKFERVFGGNAIPGQFVIKEA